MDGLGTTLEDARMVDEAAWLHAHLTHRKIASFAEDGP
jgi:hypothetical protein